jgi:mannitol-specific phosphotransferase system IIBC component
MRQAREKEPPLDQQLVQARLDVAARARDTQMQAQARLDAAAQAMAAQQMQAQAAQRMQEQAQAVAEHQYHYDVAYHNLSKNDTDHVMTHVMQFMFLGGCTIVSMALGASHFQSNLQSMVVLDF